MRPSKIEVKPATPENEGRAGGLRHHRKCQPLAAVFWSGAATWHALF